MKRSCIYSRSANRFFELRFLRVNARSAYRIVEYHFLEKSLVKDHVFQHFCSLSSTKSENVDRTPVVRFVTGHRVFRSDEKPNKGQETTVWRGKKAAILENSNGGRRLYGPTAAHIGFISIYNSMRSSCSCGCG